MKHPLPTLCVVCLFLFGAAASVAAATEKPLFDFSRNFDPQKHAKASDARLSLQPPSSGGGKILRVATGHAQRWPGVTLPLPPSQRDLSPFAEVMVKVRNAGAEPINVTCRVDNPGADGARNCLNGYVELDPGQTDTIAVTLKRTNDDKLDGKLFGMRGYPVAAGGKGTIDPGKVNQILLFINGPKIDHVFEVLDIHAAGAYVPPTAWTRDADPFFPFIDTFGQYKHKDWPGKVHSLEDLKSRRQKEAEELAQHPGPKDWDKYGGWAAGPRLKATGYFRTEKFQGKWWLVDPDGRLFFSHGVDCVGEHNVTPIEERERWFEDFPGNRPEFARFLGRGYALKGHYAGRTPRTFEFDSVNLVRKYGPDYDKTYPGLVQRRLRSWGLNTIANWSSPGIYRLRRTPYTDTIGSRKSRTIEGGTGYWSKFPDVFDPAFARNARAAMEEKRGASAGDPWCIGYFSDNEMSWGDEVSLAIAALKSPADQPAKREFVSDLKKKYSAIEKLNETWATKHASWDALLASREAPDRKRAKDDLTAFYVKTAERYFKTMREAIKTVASNQLYLGCRFAWVNPNAAAAAAKFCDVVSYNIYKPGLEKFNYNGGADVPLIIGEFHFGALDRGMFHTGLVSVNDQAARARTYIDYVRGALRHPQFVGTGWFKFQDEPLTGRVYDEENYQIGFVDVADTPYPELVDASRAVAATLYQDRLNSK